MEHEQKEAMIQTAWAMALSRLGILPCSRRGEDDALVPPQASLSRMPPDAARRAKRRYRKLWRRELAREGRAVEGTPRRRRDRDCGGWRMTDNPPSRLDALDAWVERIRSLGVGCGPDRLTRKTRWWLLKFGVSVQAEVRRAKIDLGVWREPGTKREG